MPANRGQGKTTRWYQLCFVPTSTDSSDDSDIESVVITPTTPTQSNTVEELFPLSPPLLPPPPPLPPNLECETDELALPLPLQDSLPSSPPNSEPEIDWSLLLPPPLPPWPLPRNLECKTDELPLPLSLQDVLPHQPRQGASATPTPTSTRQELSLLSSPPNPEPEIDWNLLLPLPLPPSPLPPNLECETDELPLPLSLQDFLPHQPLQGASATPTPTSTWQEPSLPSSPPDLEPEIDWSLLLPPPPPPPDFVPRLPLQRVMARIFNIDVQQDSHMFEGDQHDCKMVGRNGISRVRVSKIDKFSHCPICMDEFKVGDQASQLPCTHSYCSECILRWLNSSKTCPICRLQLDGYGSVSKNDNNGLDST